jgi:hypothetical protein
MTMTMSMSETTNQKLGARCGLDCAECPAHKVYLKDDPELRKRTAAEWSKMYNVQFDPETLFCVGCTVADGPHTGYCALCPVRACATVKQVPNCGLCDEYAACATVRGFLDMAKSLKPVLDGIAAGRGR